MLVPPDNYGLVEDGLYRCSKLDALNCAFLETLRLQSIILLDPEKPHKKLRQWAEEQGIVLHHLGGIGNSNSMNPVQDFSIKKQDWMLLKPTMVIRIFELILDQRNYNILIVDKTETVVGILRRIQKWSFSSIIEEYRLNAGGKYNYFAENFLELITVELKSYREEVPTQEDPEAETADDKQTKASPSATPEAESEAISIPSNHYRRMSHGNSFNKFRNSLERKLSSDGADNAVEEDLSESLGKRLSLSVSPQIPKNLLRRVEQRKQKKYKASSESESETEDYRYYKSNNYGYIQKDVVLKVKLPQEEYLPEWFIRGRDLWEALNGNSKISRSSNNESETT
ncbi:Protein required for replication of Brome mosaic virus [Komagataella phaffii CBS 7435]|uniref:Putative tyrosine-protein phosphatase OCA1 n=2 Tax=Komagataella phaffii TaxID=460519 RepID=C4R595_KOMPG|nr:uncharacterized protein PAS_chr3_0682 [Komagataella phaffii GS115]AOA63499.1 GQ67_03771T0 [Komagataella phaffii]CAH2449492.1 Protein required for replication of Brome mosaic virus [Komagataella phaffii CBS 7435]AOA68640.1 GQ68_03743T0 [Komagataella phaffii GS115]CAY70731.1 Cytoplasmic protein required for replication of Brome mosaic virus in S. cerevisiae [Komagataella phaffii GS115]CCA39477.1 Protein required for replication of Brome mosaic virus [Komagataella phaffii CBS 7435]